MKRLKALIYAAAALVLAGGGWVLFAYTLRGARPFAEAGEFIGVALAVLMGFEMVLWAAMLVLRRRWLPQALVPPAAKGTGWLRALHLPVGALATAALALHLSITLDLSRLTAYDQLTGCLTAGLAVLSVVVGLFYHLSPRKVRLVHVILAFAAVAAFLFHIAG